jgi:hypothetical protein
MDTHLVEKLDEVRHLLERSIRITSGVRCADYNEEIGGVQKSSHVPLRLDDGQGLVSHAVDIYVENSNYRYLITPLLWSRFQRIGFGKKFYHVDTMPPESAPDIVMWDYYNSEHIA